MRHTKAIDDMTGPVAIIGLAGRFPGANDISAYWDNLQRGAETIRFFTAEQLDAAGVPQSVRTTPGYVNAGGVLEGIEWFDARFFGITPREAQIMDPQQRLFLECAWEALEHAGYDPERYPDLIGLFAGCGPTTYLDRVRQRQDLLELLGNFSISIANEKDHLTTRAAYKLNLKGPAITVQTTCSTSLVAVCLACQSLRTRQCDLALAGGVSIGVPQDRGYLHRDGGILSPDGHCRPFDRGARGTVGGNGVGLVVLKRLEDALADRDTIHAVIRGWALNNDGARKVGYTAPSIDGQAEVIAMAQTRAGISPATIDYVEAHGTATPLGDPVEIAALTEAFRLDTTATQFCKIGSVKSGVGHLDAAAGIAGLIKTTLALEHAAIPASLNFTSANPQIDFSQTPFTVNRELANWPRRDHPRRAGVSSFGIGGTNAHVVLEEASTPSPKSDDAETDWQLLVLSARTATALERATDNLVDYLRSTPDVSFADAAYTLQVGRKAFPHRRAVVSSRRLDAAEVLAQRSAAHLANGVAPAAEPAVVFLFPGQGAQHPGMGAELYRRLPLFAEYVNDCCEQLAAFTSLDLRDVVFGRSDDPESKTLDQTAIAQPALFVLSYALARVWMKWGVVPRALVGHSVGEYVAACLAGVLTLSDALRLIALRGSMMQQVPAGSMLAVALPENRLRALLDDRLDIAAVNGPEQCVVAGTVDAVSELERRLRDLHISASRLHTARAFHSHMMDPVVGPFTDSVRRVPLQIPTTPCLSNVSGTWLTDEEAIDPAYWGRHVRQTVRFAENLQALSDVGDDLLILELGPGRALSAFAERVASGRTISCLPHPREQRAETQTLLQAVGRVWVAGVQLNWTGLPAGRRTGRVPMPTYPFERERFWIDAPAPTRRPAKSPSHERRLAPSEWLYVPSWRRGPPVTTAPPSDPQRWLAFVLEGDDAGNRVVSDLRESGLDVLRVSAGTHFADADRDKIELDPAEPADYDRLVRRLIQDGRMPARIVHLWSLSSSATSGSFDQAQRLGFYSILRLAQAISRSGVKHPIRLDVVAPGIHDVTGSEPLHPEFATLTGLLKVINQEHATLRCRLLDVELDKASAFASPGVYRHLFGDIAKGDEELVVAIRGAHRWLPHYERIARPTVGRPHLREQGVYLIAGGLGRIGLTLAEFLARAVRARLVLIGRSASPSMAEHIERAGGEVMVVRADVSDEARVRELIRDVKLRFGALHGVIHAAGVASAIGFRSLQDMDVTTCEAHFTSKARGFRALAAALSDTPLDFALVCSSLSSALGGFGFAAYAAANAYLDTAVAARVREGASGWMSVNWDGWDFSTRAAHIDGHVPSAQLFALSSEEGVGVFQDLVTMPTMSQVLVSTGDLEWRADEWSRLRPTQSVQPESSPRTPPPDAAQRGPDATALDAPSTNLEKQLATIWEQLLGIRGLGRTDNFFEVGGHSLSAIQVISRVRDLFRVEVSIQTFFDTPTVAGLAAAVAHASTSHEDDAERLRSALDLVESLSDEQVAALLAGDRGGS